ncbi:glycosyl transferase family protein [Marinobacterium arenosum]|uniref:glycosyl transferase family protein n=1 Tax=Marinobacterium arenosum TaxID=2862496 RepID=UPI001C948086|nr:glycosyl transferase family protein [Marinobacterium arenosum]MBY4675281.1 glycosyl transferase family protein [Marinobacterium arenosum]
MSHEHPFAGFIRILGKGKQGSRPLSRDEAREALTMIMRGEARPEQIGAFLMLLRVQEETPEELAGFADAVRAQMQAPSLAVDLDWATYAGKKRRHPWFVLAALCLASHGVRVFMHGAQGHTVGRLYAQQVLEALQVPICRDWQQVSAELNRSQFAYLPLERMAPALGELIELRAVLGLRSPVHTLCRMLNPLHAPASIDGVFHPPYGPRHQQTAQLLGSERNLTLKGDGGEAEARPDSESWALWLLDGELSEQQWPRLLDKRLVRDDQIDLDTVVALWRGERAHEYGEAAVISTLAITLKLLGRGEQPEALFAQAAELWAQRDIGHFV